MVDAYINLEGEARGNDEMQSSSLGFDNLQSSALATGIPSILSTQQLSSEDHVRVCNKFDQHE